MVRKELGIRDRAQKKSKGSTGMVITRLRFDPFLGFEPRAMARRQALLFEVVGSHRSLFTASVRAETLDPANADVIQPSLS